MKSEGGVVQKGCWVGGSRGVVDSGTRDMLFIWVGCLRFSLVYAASPPEVWSAYILLVTTSDRLSVCLPVWPLSRPGLVGGVLPYTQDGGEEGGSPIYQKQLASVTSSSATGILGNGKTVLICRHLS